MEQLSPHASITDQAPERPMLHNKRRHRSEKPDQNITYVVFPGGAVVENLTVMQKTCIQSLDQEDPLEKETATHSSILAWEIPWTEEPDGLHKSVAPPPPTMGSQESDMT